MVTVADAIRGRKTAKIMQDPSECSELSSDMAVTVRQTVQEMIDLAGWAPFHKVAHEQVHRQDEMTSPVPWRFYVLEKTTCCKLIQFIKDQASTDTDAKWSKAASSKIPKLLAGCSVLVNVTWLPDPPEYGSTPQLTTNNIEHIAAASAAVQNLLLAAESFGWFNYWSSGGILKDEDVFQYLGIPLNQMLLGAIFLTHPDKPYDKNQPGGLRDKRGATADWSRWINYPFA